MRINVTYGSKQAIVDHLKDAGFHDKYSELCNLDLQMGDKTKLLNKL